MTECCGSCKFYKSQGGDAGLCRRFAPRIIEFITTDWPKVDAADFCGEHVVDERVAALRRDETAKADRKRLIKEIKEAKEVLADAEADSRLAERVRGHGDGQEHALSDLHAGLLDDHILKRLTALFQGWPLAAREP